MERKKIDKIRRLEQDAVELGFVALSREEFEYLRAATRTALKAGIFKAQIFDENGKLIALQG